MSTLVDSQVTVKKTDAENIAAFGDIQIMAHNALIAFRQNHPDFSLTYEDVLAVYVETFEAAGHDFAGMWPADDFDVWVNQHESDFGDMADALFAQATGVQMM